ncbi:MAG: hypothetical protein IKX13_01635, partial [Bacteroidales bacterium]|nr:hypothetical protein [Bacteroidales bacterium]
SYCAQLADKSAPYLKTPSCVVTFHDFHTTGGHNLSSKIHRVNSMTGYRSSGAGTSTEYYPAPQPDKAGTAPDKNTSVPEKTTPPVTKKNTTTPNKATATPKSSSAATEKTTAKTVVTPNSTSKNGVRSRSSVISAQPRTNRGL